MKKVRIAIIGIGHLGSYHLKTLAELSEQVEIVGICDIKESRTKRLARLYHVPFVKDYTKLVGQIDGVDICVPTEHHHEVAEFFISNGVHAFIEKPFTSTVKQADQLIKLAQKHNAKIQVGHVERFNAAFESVRRFTKNPLFIECHRLNFFPNRSLDIGVVMDLMIHDIDIVLGLTGSKIEDINAVGVSVLTHLDDIASARISFQNGCVANLTASRVSDDVMRKIRIFQKDSYISLDYVKQEAFIYKKSRNKILKHSLPIEKEQPLKRELEHFLECIRDDKKPLVTGVEGRLALEVALKITEQIWKRQKNISS